MGVTKLPELDLAALPVRIRTRRVAAINGQTREVFEAQASVVEAASAPILWRRPSEHDDDPAPTRDLLQLEMGEDILEAMGVGRIRGILLHALLEGLLIGELAFDLTAAQLRAVDLAAQLMTLETNEGEGLDPVECAATALRARTLPGLADLWPHLVPEVPVYASDSDGTLVAGRADATAFVDGNPRRDQVTAAPIGSEMLQRFTGAFCLSTASP